MSIMWAGREKAVRNMDATRHVEIVDAIESGDVAKAAKAVAAHMAAAADTLVGVS